MAKSKFKSVVAGFALATALAAAPLAAQDRAAAPVEPAPTLEAQFDNPPNSARPRVWWHWMNGNITKDGIEKDLDWMVRVGIGGLQNFDANLQTPQIVDERLVYMTPGWKDAFRFTALAADKRGLELAIAASPGWSETGGPWVKPEDGLKKLVWSETALAGGKRFKGKLAAPPAVTGPYLSIPKQPGIDDMLGGGKPKQHPHHYADVAVLAVPLTASAAEPVATVRDGAGKVLDAALLSDADIGSGLTLTPSKDGNEPLLVVSYERPRTVQSATIFAPGQAMIFAPSPFKPVLEASDDGQTWRKVAELKFGQVPTTASFAPVSARHFRITRTTGDPSPFSMGQPEPGIAMGDLFARYAEMGAQAVQIGDFRLSGEARIDHFESKAGFAIEADYYALSKDAGEAAGVDPAKVIDLTSRMLPDGSLDWTPPKGQWKVLRMGYSLLGTENHPAPPEATGLEVDKFDGPAVRRYIEHYIGMYRDAAGADMLGQRGLQAILTDSIEVGAANWTPAMVAQFKALRGYDPTPWLPALTGTIVGSRARSDQFLFDYRRTLADLMSSEHYGTVAEVARANGLKVYGEALESGRPSLGDDMAMRRHADFPMAAMWTHSAKEGPRLSYYADIRGAASVARIYGQNVVAAESMTSAMAPWAHTPNYLRRIIDLEFVLGVNRPVIHTSVHQPRDDKFPGLSLFIFGQYFNRHDSWAEMAKPWVDYLSRTSLMLQQGRNHSDLGYFYGEEAPLTSLQETGRLNDVPKAYAFDFVNFDALTGALRNDGGELVTPGGARYRALYLGGTAHKMSLAALRKLAALVEGGATVIGLAPGGDPGLGTDPAEYAALVAKLWPGTDQARVGKGRVIASKSVEAALASAGLAPDFRYSGGKDGHDIPFLHRKLADGDSYFLVNRKQHAETVEARFRVTGKAPELWNAETGKSSPVSYRIEGGETVVPLTLEAEKSIFVVFRKPAAAPSLTVAARNYAPAAALEGSWTVRFQPGRAAPAEAVLPALGSLSSHSDPAIKYFSGMATYVKDVAAPKGWKPGRAVLLDLGEVNELAEVTVNGKVVGTVWQAPYTIDIGPALKKGKNRIEIKVANRWINRLIGDAQPGAQKITFTAMPSYNADAPLRPSGLVGPVTLQVEAK
jgi:alpha-L-rhamnosidase